MRFFKFAALMLLVLFLLIFSQCRSINHLGHGAATLESAVELFADALVQGDYSKAADLCFWEKDDCLGILLPLVDEKSYPEFAVHHPKFSRQHPKGLQDPFFKNEKILIYRELIQAQGRSLKQGQLSSINGWLWVLSYNRIMSFPDHAGLEQEALTRNSLLIKEIRGRFYIFNFTCHQFSPEYAARAD